MLRSQKNLNDIEIDNIKEVEVNWLIVALIRR